MELRTEGDLAASGTATESPAREHQVIVDAAKCDRINYPMQTAVKATYIKILFESPLSHGVLGFWGFGVFKGFHGIGMIIV